jgi:hypothetical protein
MAVSVGGGAAWRKASANALLLAFPKPLDDVLPVLLGDRLADLPDQHVLPVPTVVRGHVDDKDPDTSLEEDGAGSEKKRYVA